MINQGLAVTPTKTRGTQFPSTLTVGGTPILVGVVPAVTLDAYQANVAGATCYFDGAYLLTVTGVSTLSPAVNAAIGVGAAVYMKGGTLDSTTNVTSGGVLCSDSSGVLFGYIDPQLGVTVGSGLTSQVYVSIANKI
jgi:hypothetical protein